MSGKHCLAAALMMAQCIEPALLFLIARPYCSTVFYHTRRPSTLPEVAQFIGIGMLINADVILIHLS